MDPIGYPPPPPTGMPQPVYPPLNPGMQIPMQMQQMMPNIPVQTHLIPGTQKLGTGGKLYLQTSKSVIIKEKPQYIELVGLNRENIYTVYAGKPTPGGLPKGEKLFKVKERSSCVCRNCCTPQCRPFSVMIWAFMRDPTGQTQKQKFLKLTRPCRCTFLCLNRPYMTVHYYKPGLNPGEVRKIKLGTLNFPCCYRCTDPCSHYYTLDGKRVGSDDYLVKGDCDQFGFCCGIDTRCCAPFCNKAKFNISKEDGSKIGKITKVKNTAFLQFMVLGMDKCCSRMCFGCRSDEDRTS